MSAKTLITKYFLIISFIKANRYASLVEIIEFLKTQMPLRGINEGISERTTKRYLKEIREFLNISIEYDRSMGGYFVPTDEMPDEVVMSILEDFTLLNLLTNQGIKERFILPERRRSRGVENFIPLRQAIHDSVVVSFEYRKYYPEVSERRTMEPYALKESRGRWYVLGFDRGTSHPPKSFGLDRISGVTVSNQKFVPRTDIDWAKRYEHCFAMFSGDDLQPEHVVLSFDHHDGNYLESMPLHPSQTLRREVNRTIVELDIKITLDFIMELISRSWSIEVLQPKSLRAQLREIYEGALGRNS
jgi:predicted DNA-binding transcriptional regulator YafY